MSMIDRMSADHHAEMEHWERSQKDGLARVLMDIIMALGVHPRSHGVVGPDDPLLFGGWLKSDILARIDELRGLGR